MSDLTDRLLQDVLETLEEQFESHMARHYDFLDAHDTLPAEFARAQAEAVADAALAVVKRLELKEPEWLRAATRSSE